MLFDISNIDFAPYMVEYMYSKNLLDDYHSKNQDNNLSVAEYIDYFRKQDFGLWLIGSKGFSKYDLETSKFDKDFEDWSLIDMWEYLSKAKDILHYLNGLDSDFPFSVFSCGSDNLSKAMEWIDKKIESGELPRG